MCIFVKNLKTSKMEITMRLAIKTYSDLTSRTPKSVMKDVINGNKVVLESIQLIMFAIETK